MFGFMMFAWVWFSRGIIRFIVRSYLQAGVPKKRIAIYGAGYAGQQVAATLNRSNEHLPVMFIDDDPSLSGQNIGGIKVYVPETALKCFTKLKIDEILIALPSVGRIRKSEIVKFLEPAHLKITEIRGLTKLVNGEIRVSDIQEVDIIDLLGVIWYRQFQSFWIKILKIKSSWSQVRVARLVQNYVAKLLKISLSKLLFMS